MDKNIEILGFQKNINEVKIDEKLMDQNEFEKDNIIIDNCPQNISNKEKLKIVNKNDSNQNLNKATSSIIQEKLKNIFLEREKAKLKYNKQSIPEQLKYTSSEDEDSCSIIINRTDKNKIIKENQDNNINLVNNNISDEKIEEKNEGKKNEFKLNEEDKIMDSIKKSNEKNIKEEKEIINNSKEKNDDKIKENIENKNKIYNNDDDNKKINEVKSFSKRIKEESKEKNSYQLLLSKKIKNFVDSDDEEEENKSKEIKNEEKAENENIKNEENSKNIIINKIKNEEIKDNNNEEEINKENIILKKELNENKDIEETLNKKDKNKSINTELNKQIENKECMENKKEEDNVQKNELENYIDNKNIDSEQDKDTKLSTKTNFRSSGVIQLNQNINIENNNSENEEKFTELPTPQKDKLTINLKSSKRKEIKDDIPQSISPKNLTIKNDNPRTINRYDNNSKTIKEDSNSKNNIMILLQLIKNKKNEREKIDKEKEKAKEEVYKRSKSQAVSRNLENFHKFRNHSTEKEKEKKEQNTNQMNIDFISDKDFNQKIELGKNISINSPKQEVYSRKNNIKQKNIVSYKSNKKNLNINIKNVKNFCGQNSKNKSLTKVNSKVWSTNKNKNMDRIVVNHRIKKNLNQENIKNNQNFKEVINRYATSNISKNKNREKYNDLEIDLKKTYEKPIFIYNKNHVQNRSLDMENNDSYNFYSNNMSKNPALNGYGKNSERFYNQKKGMNDNSKSIGKSPNSNCGDKINKKYYANNDYIYNYNNYFRNNNGSNNIYVKKKSFLVESNIDTNTSSCNLSKSINNHEKNKNYYSINSKNEKSGIGPNYYSMIPQNENSNRKINLKVNKKSFYLNDKNYIANKENENTDLVGRSFISEKNNIVNKNNYNEKKEEKYNSYITKRNNKDKRYNKNVSYNNINNNQNSKKLELQKYSKNNKEILNDYEDGDNISYNNFMNYYGSKSQRKKKEHKRLIFKLEELLVLEEKLNNIIENLRDNKEIYKQCFDFLNYYFNSSILKKIEKIYEDEQNINIAKLSINYELIYLIICYEYSMDQDIYLVTNNKLLEIMELNYSNLMSLFQQIIDNIKEENKENIWNKKLLNIFDNFSQKEDLFISNDDILFSIEKIKHNNNRIFSKIHDLLNYYQTENNTLLLNYFLQLKTKTYEDLNSFFQKNILQIENEEGSLVASLYLRNNSIFSPISPPYLKNQNTKKYTLVLDLDETLVNFKIKKGREGYVRLRPFLFGFLEEVSQYYELIIFTSATEAYANSVIEAIQHDKKYFDYIFYRQHTIIVGNDFVKDLTRIGRPLNSTIIIDNMPQNFRFQKENGISIKPFWGQDSNDKTLYDLMPILLDIAKSGGDVRISLNKYKDEIIGKITSNISKK